MDQADLFAQELQRYLVGPDFGPADDAERARSRLELTLTFLLRSLLAGDAEWTGPELDGLKLRDVSEQSTTRLVFDAGASGEWGELHASGDFSLQAGQQSRLELEWFDLGRRRHRVIELSLQVATPRHYVGDRGDYRWFDLGTGGDVLDAFVRSNPYAVLGRRIAITRWAEAVPARSLTPTRADRLVGSGWDVFKHVLVTPRIGSIDELPASNHDGEWWIYLHRPKAWPHGMQTMNLWFCLDDEPLDGAPPRAAGMVRAKAQALWREIDGTQPESVFLGGQRLVVVTRTATVAYAIRDSFGGEWIERGSEARSA